MAALSVEITKSPKPDKKLKAVFQLDNGRTKTIHFGAKGMSDFTIHKDITRRGRYDARHIAREDWENPLTAGSLSKYILWNKKTLDASIKDFKKRFKLK